MEPKAQPYKLAPINLGSKSPAIPVKMEFKVPKQIPTSIISNSIITNQNHND